MTAFQLTEEEFEAIDRDVVESAREAAEWLRGNREAPDHSGVYERTDRDTIPAPPPDWGEETLDIDVVFEDVG